MKHNTGTNYKCIINKCNFTDLFLSPIKSVKRSFPRENSKLFDDDNCDQNFKKQGS